MQNELKDTVIGFLTQRRVTAQEKLHSDAIQNIAKSTKDFSMSHNDIKEKINEITSQKQHPETRKLEYILRTYDLVNVLLDSFLDMQINFKEDKTQKSMKLYEYKIYIQSKSIAIENKYTPNQWLDFVTTNAKNTSVRISHIAKLTHPSSKGSNFLFSNSSKYKSLLSTESLRKPIFDYSYSNAAYAAVAEFLQLECQNTPLCQLLFEQPELFEQFTQDKTQFESWKIQIAVAFDLTQAKSHVLAKQVYFPVAQNYHLLSPLVSSSLAHHIFEKISYSRNKDNASRKARDKGFYHQEIDTAFNRVAVQMVTQSQHQNASNLNGDRSGRLFLLSSAPPQWRVQAKPPTKTFFNKLLAYRAKEPLEELKNLLLAIKSQELSLNLERKKLIIQHITAIADLVFDAVIETHQMHSAGWSANSNLDLHQQYWLDPYRTDENFQKNRQDIDWSFDVLYDFSRWINLHIDIKGIEKENLWQKILTEPLREFNACTNADIPQMDREI